MSAAFERFLNARRPHARGASLGRAFTVVRQSWKLIDDPRTTAPEVEVLASRRTASEAADLAREAAWSYRRYGFHKPSGAWWGVEGENFHRFVIRPGGMVTGGAVAAILVAGVAAFALSRRGASRAEPEATPPRRGRWRRRS